MLDKSFIVVNLILCAHRFPAPHLFLVQCLGYVIRESPTERELKQEDEGARAAAFGRLRKVVLLGDTNNPDGIIPLVNSSPGHVALAVHEATDCYIPVHVDPQQHTGKNRSVESVHSISLQRGHSTPHMAGKFANEIGARRLVLNHLGGRYDPFPNPCRIGILICGICRFPAPGRGRDDEFRENVMYWIEQQATEAWAPERHEARAEAAVDFLTVRVKPITVPVPPHPETGVMEPRAQFTQMDQALSSTNIGQTSGHERRYERYTNGPPIPSDENDPRKRQRTERQAEKQREDVMG